MGLKDTLHNKRVYFDTNIFIYLLEGNEVLKDALQDIRDLIADDQIQVLSSDLVYTEILPFHARKNDQDTIEHIIGFLGNFELAPISFETTIHAGILRGETGMKTPDALHVASSVQSNCDIFLTNDAGISVPSGMERVLLSKVSMT